MRVTTRTGRNTYVSVDGVTYVLGWFFCAMVVVIVVVAAAYFLLCWPEALVQWLFPDILAMVVIGWFLSAVWSIFLLVLLLRHWLRQA